MKLFNRFDILTMFITVRQIGPGYVTLHLKSILGEFQILQTVVPVEPLMQRVLHRFYFPRGHSLFAKFIIWGEAIMVCHNTRQHRQQYSHRCSMLQFERDMVVWNNMKFIDKPLLLKEEKSIRAFRIWFSQFYTESSRTLAQLKDETLQW